MISALLDRLWPWLASTMSFLILCVFCNVLSDAGTAIKRLAKSLKKEANQ